MKKIKVGIVGGAGYTGGELIRILLNHPNAEIAYVQSVSQEGRLVTDVHTDLIGELDLIFVKEGGAVDVVFLCLAHGQAVKLLETQKHLLEAKLIDLSQDHRIGKFVYGLPELNRTLIRDTEYVANPGCFATGIQLALLPLGDGRMVKGELHVSATTGSTGAGQTLAQSSHFSWRQNNLSIYKSFVHQHLAEINQTLKGLQPEFDFRINFVPMRGSFTRGIFGSVYLNCDLSLPELEKIYDKFYETHPFVHRSEKSIDLKQVVNTNKCLVHLEKHEGKVLISFCIDNLLKGASGQAVQNMNLMFGLPETAGLKLKANYF